MWLHSGGFFLQARKQTSLNYIQQKHFPEFNKQCNLVGIQQTPKNQEIQFDFAPSQIIINLSQTNKGSVHVV